jgi:molybdopterin-synthase adenylyltransferase
MTERYSRNEGLFGTAGQAMIAATRVAIIGLGGLGSHVTQQLAHLGVQSYALVDFDHVTESSLNRLVGAIDTDIATRTLKIDVAERVITSVQPEATIDKIDRPLTDPAAIAAITSADVVFGCVDRDTHRLDLTDITARHAKPYFDLATDTAGDDHEIYGGRVVLADGTQCVVCLPEVLDQHAISLDRLDPNLLEAHDRIYGVDGAAFDRTGPAVVSINGVVASLAVTEFMARTTGLREPVTHLIYRADLGIVRRSNDQPAPDCYYCTGLWGTSAT